MTLAIGWSGYVENKDTPVQIGADVVPVYLHQAAVSDIVTNKFISN
jgi:hypothetical protein